jgi:putative hydrolase of the HAD superfamily
MTTKRFDAILFDAGGVLIMPDPVAVGAALDQWAGPRPIQAFHRAHHLALSTLERSVLTDGAGHLESVDWTLYRRTYASSIGVTDDHLDAATVALSRIWSPIMWRFRIEETMGALWQLRRLGVPMGVVSNASGQVEHSLRYEGVCQVGVGGWRGQARPGDLRPGHVGPR